MVTTEVSLASLVVSISHTTTVIKEEEPNVSLSDEGMREEDENDRRNEKRDTEEVERLSTGQGR